MAAKYELPVVLHIVGHQQRAYDILRDYPLKFLIHGYAGSTPAFENFLKLDSYFTISERILKPDKETLLTAMMNSGRFLFETDITRHYLIAGEANPLLRLKTLLAACAERFDIGISWLTQVQALNYQLLSGDKLP